MALCALSVGDKFSLGGITTLLGLGMTFVVLAILIGCIILMDFILKKLSEFLRKRKEGIASQNALSGEEISSDDAMDSSSVNDDVSMQSSVSSAENMQEIDAETMAAIRSAVAIYAAENNDDGKPHENVIVKSVTRM